MDIFLEIHCDLPREAPGDSASTRRALSLLPHLPLQPAILDIGCGPGLQTIELAKATQGTITAVDIHPPFLDTLKQRAIAAGIADQIVTVNASMLELDFAGQQFDVIWSEGAIYIIGFQQGLESWRSLLKPGGYLVASELSWIQANPPDEILQYWTTNYPAMQTIAGNRQIIEASGYRAIADFVVPESAWWDDYYTPMQARITSLRQKSQGEESANQALDAAQQEIDLYRQYSDWYGYVFYVMQHNVGKAIA